MSPYSTFHGFIPKVLVKLAQKSFLIKSSFRSQLGKTGNRYIILEVIQKVLIFK